MLMCMKAPLAACLCALCLLAACSRSNDLLFGRVETTLGTHTVVVTDCYRTSVPPARQYVSLGQPAYRFTPCRDADILIEGEHLTVNGQSYGALQPGDGVLVDHGVVKVQSRPR
jgi:hypothetical protein